MDKKVCGAKHGKMEKQRIIFLKQLAVIIGSGIPLLQGLELLARRSVKLGPVCNGLMRQLRGGSTLADAMAGCGGFFPHLAVTLTAAGEQSGQLTQVLLELADYYERQLAMKQFIYKAALYPLFLLGSSLLVLLFFLFYVLPMLAAVYASMQAAPGGFLAAALSLHAFCRDNLLLLFLLALALACITAGCRRQLRILVMGLPVIGRLHNLLLEARFCKLLALLLNSGINITDAVRAAAGTIDDYRWQQSLRLFNGRLQRGMDIGLAVRGAGAVFSPLTLELVAIGAASGRLPQMLLEAAQIAEQDMRSQLERFKEVLAPVLLLAAALVTAAVVCAVIGPLFNLFNNLPEYN